jgi:hypothetical protein
MDLYFRETCPDDRSYILATLLRSYVPHLASNAGPETSRKLLYSSWNALICDLLDRPDVRVVVAHPPENDSLILGYAIAIDDIAVYVYVRDGMRMQGIARELVGQLPQCNWLAMMTPVGKHIARLFPGAAYNPMELHEVMRNG